MLYVLEREVDVLLAVRERNGALLRRQREKVNASLDEIPPHSLVQTEVVVRSQIVPIFWAVIHKVDAERRTLPGYRGPETHLGNYFLETSLHPFSQRFYVAINFTIIHQQALHRRDRGCGRHRMRIISTCQQDTFLGFGMDKPFIKSFLPPSTAIG